jgi:glycosyltransferase involved in cell wall biosynthesis
MLRFSDDQLDEMGRKGKKMVAERFSWKAAAEKLVEAYKTLV